MNKIMAVLALLLACGMAQAESVVLKLQGGTYVVSVLVNDRITLDFTVDSGAADVSIPADVFSTLIRTGTIVRTDLLDKVDYELADGSTRTSQRFRIRSLKIGGLYLHDVQASVAPAEGSLLLGQSFLSRLKSWSIDNERRLLVFNEPYRSAGIESSPASGNQPPIIAAARVTPSQSSAPCYPPTFPYYLPEGPIRDRQQLMDAKKELSEFSDLVGEYTACLKREQSVRLDASNLSSREKDDILSYYAGKRVQIDTFLKSLNNRVYGGNHN